VAKNGLPFRTRTSAGGGTTGEQEHEQQSDETSEEREETMKDLDVPEQEGKDVKGGSKFQPIELKR
jgi:hypothetical protein